MRLAAFRTVVFQINTPDAEHRGCCSYKVVAVGFHPLYYGAERRGMKPSARIDIHSNAKHFVWSQKAVIIG
ncbi:hypothetical protein GWP43_11980 [Treponema vincentii]|uniref:Uncharacterized protein n=1 Tax=Treponema vincentii TaxID=69710 RepID=A0A6P1Y466_9SPIR|nr:hypothetical protein GWP43_11980 [Treponema vincentii]